MWEIVRDVVSFILSLAMPLIITLTIQFVMAEVFHRPDYNLYGFLKAMTHMESTEGKGGDGAPSTSSNTRSQNRASRAASGLARTAQRRGRTSLSAR